MKRRVFAALLIGSAAGGAARLLAAETPNEIKVLAMKFDYLPDTITVKKGKPVVLELIALDRVHGFDVPGLDRYSASRHLMRENHSAAADSFAVTEAFLAARLKAK